MACTASFGVFFVDILIDVVLILHVQFLDRPKLMQKGLGAVRWAFKSIWPTRRFSPLPHLKFVVILRASSIFDDTTTRFSVAAHFQINNNLLEICGVA
jgi:hypothetical protein